MAAAADTPIIALFISSSFPKPRRLSVAVGGPVNYSDADEGDLVPQLGQLATFIQAAHPPRRPMAAAHPAPEPQNDLKTCSDLR